VGGRGSNQRFSVFSAVSPARSLDSTAAPESPIELNLQGSDKMIVVVLELQAGLRVS
jgi:hypothetical protein